MGLVILFGVPVFLVTLDTFLGQRYITKRLFTLKQNKNVAYQKQACRHTHGTYKTEE